MRRGLLALCLLLVALTGGPLHGQGRLPDASSRFAWSPEARSTANVLSDVTLVSQLVADTLHSWRDDDRSRAFWRQGCRMGVSQGTTLLAKHFLHQRRPDGSDDKSFWSGHTSDAAAAQGWEWSIGVPLTGLTGLFRVGAGKHDLVDVTVGALVGTGAHYLCERVIR